MLGAGANTAAVVTMHQCEPPHAPEAMTCASSEYEAKDGLPNNVVGRIRGRLFQLTPRSVTDRSLAWCGGYGYKIKARLLRATLKMFFFSEVQCKVKWENEGCLEEMEPLLGFGWVKSAGCGLLSGNGTRSARGVSGCCAVRTQSSSESRARYGRYLAQDPQQRLMWL